MKAFEKYFEDFTKEERKHAIMDHFDISKHNQWRCAVCKEIRTSELDLLDDLQGVLTLTKSGANIFEEYRNEFLVIFNPTKEELNES